MALYKITEQDLVMEVPANAALRYAVPMKDFKLFCLLNNGFFEVWDIRNLRQALFRARTDAKADKVCAIDEQLIVLYDLQNQNLCVLDLNRGYDQIVAQPATKHQTLNLKFEVENFKPTVPTQRAVPGQSRIDRPQLEDMLSNSQIFSIPKQKSFILVEKKVVSNGAMTDFIISFFSPLKQSEHVKQENIQLSNKFNNIAAIDQNGLLAFYPVSCKKEQIEFYVYDITQPYSDNNPQKFNFKIPVDYTIIDATNYGPDSVAFWANPTTEQLPGIYIFNLKTQEEQYKEIDLTNGEGYMLSGIHEVDLAKGRIIVEIITEDRKICFIDARDFRCRFAVETLSHEYNLEFSLDKRFYVYHEEENAAFDNGEMVEEEQNRIIKKKLKINSIIGTRSWLMFLMRKTGTANQYSEETLKRVIDMLTVESENQEAGTQSNTEFSVNSSQRRTRQQQLVEVDEENQIEVEDLEYQTGIEREDFEEQKQDNTHQVIGNN